MKKNLSIIVLSIALIISVGINICNYFDSDVKTTNYEPLLTILSHPNVYDGKTMLIEGVLSMEDDGIALYLSNEHKVNNAKKNALYINFEFPQDEYDDLLSLDGTYVDIKGKLNFDKHGPKGCYSGVIEDIEKCMPNGISYGPTAEHDDGSIVLTD